ncbi:DUF4260 domain-containing protein [Asticcacaulis biprosthecium]|nr:DUF4260 domain-containing protein [Asticcacaulis biprosthecium]
MQGYVTGAPKRLLQLEGLAVLVVTAWLYSRFGSGWGAFALFFLAPDLAMLGYLGGRKVGAALYNIGHSYLLPLGLLAFGVYANHSLALSAGLIWAAHIGFDRMLGYGLKYVAGFGFTHLSQKGVKA